MRAIVPLDHGSYSYAGMGYANPHAVTQLANGQSTTTYSYDQNGNLVQKTTDGVTTTYLWDYANRLIALGSGGATTTYGYDPFGSRVLQSTATTTTLYPFKWYSVASSTGSGAQFATTTEYVWSGDTLVSTVVQQFASGDATGTARTLYIHPDHLGSTNVVTNASGTVVQTLDYYPFGATRISQSTGGANSARKYITQFRDNSSLDYFQKRYYDNSRGQFISQDPMFWSQRQNLSDPQSFNSYSYAQNNPITGKDPTGESLTAAQNSTLTSIAAQLQGILGALNVMAPNGGGVSAGAAGQIQQQINTARSTVSGIAIGSGATMSPSYQWAPPQRQGNTVSDYKSIPQAPGAPTGQMPPLMFDALMFGAGMVTPWPGDEYVGGAGLIKGVGGYVERNGFKFSEKYYGKLWETGRTAPGFRAEAIVNSATKVVADPMGRPGFMNYVSESAFSKPWNVIMNPVTREVWHMGPF